MTPTKSRIPACEFSATGDASVYGSLPTDERLTARRAGRRLHMASREQDYGSCFGWKSASNLRAVISRTFLRPTPLRHVERSRMRSPFRSESVSVKVGTVVACCPSCGAAEFHAVRGQKVSAVYECCACGVETTRTELVLQLSDQVLSKSPALGSPRGAHQA
jgi:predicted RNA-binding Zn-ribbon protein involved in translation (DUF1610 family)